MKIIKAVFILLFLVASCGGGGGNGGPDGDGSPPGQGGEFFIATLIFGDNSIDYQATNGSANISFTQVTIITFDQQGNSFNMSFFRPDEVPAEITLGLGPLDPLGGAIIAIGADVFVYESGTLLLLVMTNERVAGEFDFFARSQISGITVQVIGSFDITN